MIQLKIIDLELIFSGQGEIIPLSQPADPRWAGIRSLAEFEDLHLEDGVRTDAYVLFGKITEYGREHSMGSFLGRGQASLLKAGAGGAIVFIYRDRLAKRSGHETWKPEELDWFEGGVEGMSVALLSKMNHRLHLVSWQPGTRVPRHNHPHGEEIFVVDGELKDERGAYPVGSWIRMHPGSTHAPYSDTGALTLLRSGHLSGHPHRNPGHSPP